MGMEDDMSVFRQIDYLWLFDEYLKFSERPNFTLDDLSVTIEDYPKMRFINRTTLTRFIQSIQHRQPDPPHVSYNDTSFSPPLEELWADEILDEELKAFIS